MAKVPTKDIATLSRAFGFRTKREFVEDAVAEKVRRLKAFLFARAAERVRRGIARAGWSEGDILRDFERSRRA